MISENFMFSRKMDNKKFQEEISREQNQVYNLYQLNEPFVPYIKDQPKNFLYQLGWSSVSYLGEGSYGKVYQWGVDYVVKSIPIETFGPTEEQYQDIVKLTHKLLGSPRKVWLEKILEILYLQGQVSPSQVVDPTKKIYDPQEVMSKQSKITVEIENIGDINCQVSVPYTVNIQRQNLSIERGDYVCLDDGYREFLIGLYLNKNVTSIHFIRTLGYDVNDGVEHLYFPLADTDLRNLKERKEIDLNTYLFIILSHLRIMTILGINHNDLTAANILIKKNPYPHKYFEYRLFDNRFYFPAPPYIPWITDFGLAQKMTTPKILSYTFLHRPYDYETIPAFDTFGFYDLFLVLASLVSRTLLSPLGEKIFKYFFGDYKLFLKAYGSCDPGRPKPQSFPHWNVPPLDTEVLKLFFSSNLIKPEVPESDIFLATEFP